MLKWTEETRQVAGCFNLARNGVTCSILDSGTTSREAIVEVEFKTILYGGIILQGVVHSCRACLVPTR